MSRSFVDSNVLCVYVLWKSPVVMGAVNTCCNLVGGITIETGSVESLCIICCMLRELTYVLTTLLFYDFLLSNILTSCDGCI